MPAPLTVHLIAAARPNFMKVAPLFHALTASADFDPVLVHTGQHYDANMSDFFFRDLGLPKPHHHLGVGSGGHGEQTGRVLIEYEKVCQSSRPDWIVVVGDVNPTAACAMVGAKLHIPVAHLEAGLRSFDRSMPEEINRLVTDAISDVLWTPSPDGDEHLAKEGVDPARITRVGNIMLDSFEMQRGQIEAATIVEDLGLTAGDYAVVTLHRPSNVDHEATLTTLVDKLLTLSTRLPLVFPLHPRTRKQLTGFGLMDRLAQGEGVRIEEPLSYIPFMRLVSQARLVITDSGGLQEETTYLGLPCLTLRPNTERPITITEGTNRLVTADNFLESVDAALAQGSGDAQKPEFWDGKTAQRVVADLAARSRQRGLLD